MSNQYTPYDLTVIKKQLGKKEWEKVLSVFAPVRLATVPQVMEATGMSRKGVAGILRALVAVRQTGEPEAEPDDEPEEDDTWQTWDEAGETDSARPASDSRPPVDRRIVTRFGEIRHRAWDRTGATAYQLGQLGAALLREMGLVTRLRKGGLRGAAAVSHSLCILDVLRSGEKRGVAGLRAEKVLVNGAGTKIRADVAAPVLEAGGGQRGWRLVEIEQAARESNYLRIVKRLLRLKAFFSGARGGEAVRPVILLLFNRRYVDMDRTLLYWRWALSDAADEQGRLPFELRYANLLDFLDKPRWDVEGAEQYPRLAPESKPEKVTTDPLGLADEAADFRGLFDLACRIYSLSRGHTTLQDNYRVPVASLRAMRDWLATDAESPLRLGVTGALGVLQPQWMPAIVVSALSKLMWNIVLRRWGIDRRYLGSAGEFQVAVASPGLGSEKKMAGYSDYHVRVWLEAGWFNQLAREGVVAEDLAVDTATAALEWFLGAFYTYAYELGLRSAPWLE